jgi:hypothetical protein
MTDKPHQPQAAAQQTAPPATTVNERVEVFHCRVRNPSQRARVIYGGELSNITYHIPPQMTVEALLSDDLIDTLARLENADPEEQGLHVEELGKYEPPPPPQPRERRHRPGRTAA